MQVAQRLPPCPPLAEGARAEDRAMPAPGAQCGVSSAVWTQPQGSSPSMPLQNGSPHQQTSPCSQAKRRGCAMKTLQLVSLTSRQCLH